MLGGVLPHPGPWGESPGRHRRRRARGSTTACGAPRGTSPARASTANPARRGRPRPPSPASERGATVSPAQASRRIHAVVHSQAFTGSAPATDLPAALRATSRVDRKARG